MTTANASSNGEGTVHLKIKRQDGPGQKPYWQEFKVPRAPGMNVISCLDEIRKNPATMKGARVAPVIWECACLEEVCGSCSMRINGMPQQSCSALVDKLKQPIVLEPMSKFPVVRDLIVDRQSMFDNLRKIKAWVPIDGTHDLGPGPRVAPREQRWMYALSRCMTCGVCLDACPQVNPRSSFMGAAIISQARLFNAHPSGEMHKESRLEALMGPGGIADCGNAQNCVRVCPKGIQLTQSIAEMGAETVKYGIRRFFRKPAVET